MNKRLYKTVGILLTILIIALIKINHVNSINEPEIENTDESEIESIDELEIPHGTVNNDFNRDNNSKEVIVDTISKLKIANSEVGMIFRTEGYYTKNDGGGARYLIVDIKNEKDDSFLDIKLNNGLYAELILSSDEYVNVQVAGIRTEEKISERLNYVIQSLVGKVKGIKFLKGKYYIDKIIELNSMEYVGEDDVELIVSPNFIGNDDKVFSTQDEYSFSGQNVDICFSNINVLLEESANQEFPGQELVLFKLTGIKHFNLSNCEVVVKKGIDNIRHYAVTNILFKDSDIQNVEISNCTIKNLSAEGETKKQHFIGGCLWFYAGNDNRVIENIKVQGCNFISTCSDELLGVWNANIVSNFYISDCEFTVLGDSNISDNSNAMTFFNSSFSDTTISNCIFNISGSSMRIIKIFRTVNDKVFQIDFDSCTINAVNNLISPWKNNISLFSFSDLSKDKDVINITNCNFLSNKDTQYRCIVECSNIENSHINLLNNDIEINTSSGLFWIENSSANIQVKNNQINLYSGGLITVKNSCKKTILEVISNTIDSSCQGNIFGNVLLDYYFKSNKINYQKRSTLFNNVEGVIQQQKSNLFVSDNNINDINLLRYYYCNYDIGIDDSLNVIKE